MFLGIKMPFHLLSQKGKIHRHRAAHRPDRPLTAHKRTRATRAIPVLTGPGGSATLPVHSDSVPCSLPLSSGAAVVLLPCARLLQREFQKFFGDSKSVVGHAQLPCRAGGAIGPAGCRLNRCPAEKLRKIDVWRPPPYPPRRVILTLVVGLVQVGPPPFPALVQTPLPPPRLTL